MPAEYKSEAAVFRLIEQRFSSPEWATFSQVADSTGWGQSRWADAVSMGIWPSRGNEIHGFEIKVTRSDWLNELKDHKKSAAVQKYCHRWWIVAGKRDIVDPDELPKTWGLMIPRGKGLQIKVQAPLLEPAPPTYKFIAAVLRRAQEKDKSAEQEWRNKVFAEISERAKESAVERAKIEISQEVYELKREVSNLRRQIQNKDYRLKRYQMIEKASGVSLSQIDYKKVVKALTVEDVGNVDRTLQMAFQDLSHRITKLAELYERGDEMRELLRETYEDTEIELP